MSLKVVSFDARSARKAEVISRLKDLLAKAENGEITDFSYACSMLDGSTISGFTETDDAPRRLGGVSMLLFRIQQVMQEHSRLD